MRTEYSDCNRHCLAWVAVNTHSQREGLALQNLQRQEFRAYCPMALKRVRVGRREREMLRPLFPGYVFVAVSRAIDRWRPILSTYGVRSILRCGDDLSLLDDGFIAALRAREVAGAVVRPGTPYAPGQQIRVTGGAFEGIIATILDLDEKDRIIVLLDLLGKTVQARFEVANVAPVAG